jgi:hypothetical protein
MSKNTQVTIFDFICMKNAKFRALEEKNKKREMDAEIQRQEEEERKKKLSQPPSYDDFLKVEQGQKEFFIVRMSYKFIYVSDGWTEFTAESENDPQFVNPGKVIQLYLFTTNPKDVERGFGRVEDPKRQWFCSSVAKVFRPIGNCEIVDFVPKGQEVLLWNKGLGDFIWKKMTKQNKQIRNGKILEWMKTTN